MHLQVWSTPNRQLSDHLQVFKFSAQTMHISVKKIEVLCLYFPWLFPKEWVNAAVSLNQQLSM